MQHSKDIPPSAPTGAPDAKESSSSTGQKRSLDDSSTKVENSTDAAENAPPAQQHPKAGATLSSSSEPKKHKPNEHKIKENLTTTVDIAETLNLQPGARIEVQWDLHFENYDDANNYNSTKDNTETTENKQTRWWGGTLLQPDSRTRTLQDDESSSFITDEVTVPIRVIDYDPFPEGGFLERSLEDVCFLSDHSLLNIASDTRAYWRKEGEDWEPSMDADEEERALMADDAAGTSGPIEGGLPAGLTDPGRSSAAAAGDQSDDDSISVTSASKEDALKVILDTVLMSAMQKSGVLGKMNQLEASQKSFMAAKIAMAKEKLSQKLMEQLNANGSGNNTGSGGGGGGGVITEEHVVKCVEEFQKG